MKDEPYLSAASDSKDLLYQNHCTPEQVTVLLNDAAHSIKEKLPNIPIVIADPLLDHDRIQSLPTNVDWFGLSLYPTSSSDYESFSIGTNPELNMAGYTELRMSVNSYINKLKNKVPGKKILLIPVAYKLKAQEVQNTQDMMDLTKKYFELAYSEPAIVAVLPYVVNTHPENGVWFYSALDNPKLKTAYNNFSQTLFGLPNIALGKQVQSLVAENNSLYPASNLTDGDESTLSYPNAPSFDYVIDLGSTYKIDAIRLVLKHFGLTSTSTYITSWEVNGIDANGNSSLIRSGSSSPNSEYVGISKIGDTISSYKKIRIKAQSTSHWIGILEAQVFGVPGADPPRTSPNIALGKPVTSYITGASQYVYSASNLTDGNESTVAYPANVKFDYEIDLQATYKIERIRLVLGYWGLISTNIYITSWQVFGIDANGNSKLITSSNTSPNSEYVDIPVSGSPSYKKIRIAAQSTTNWIGILEAQVFGAPN